MSAYLTLLKKTVVNKYHPATKDIFATIQQAWILEGPLSGVKFVIP
jgi:hypothetical protein